MHTLETDQEEQIVAMFRRGEPSAMDRLYALYANYLTGVCMRYIGNDDDVKDVLQDAFVKIFTQMDKFSYRGKGSLRAWVSRIVVNQALQFLRQRKADGCLTGTDNLPDLPDEEPDIGSVSAETIVSLMRKMPEGYRTVLNLFLLEGKSHKEIAGLLGIKPSTSASQFHHARNMLARMIKDYKRQHE